MQLTPPRPPGKSDCAAWQMAAVWLQLRYIYIFFFPVFIFLLIEVDGIGSRLNTSFLSRLGWFLRIFFFFKTTLNSGWQLIHRPIIISHLAAAATAAASSSPSWSSSSDKLLCCHFFRLFCPPSWMGSSVMNGAEGDSFDLSPLQLNETYRAFGSVAAERKHKLRVLFFPLSDTSSRSLSLNGRDLRTCRFVPETTRAAAAAAAALRRLEQKKHLMINGCNSIRVNIWWTQWIYTKTCCFQVQFKFKEMSFYVI